jgi:hypothetical protein
MPTDVELATRAIMRLAEEARHDLSKFYAFVMRNELTREPLTPAPHQTVMFSFVENHDRCVFRQPIGTGKTFGMAAVTLYLMGADITQRGAVISKARHQASKVLGMVKDYITEPSLNARLALVYPWLKPSPRQGDPWTQSQITIERPPGIRDASLVAVGVDGAIAGSRISWLVTDDVIDDENTNSPQARDLVQSRFDGRLMARLDPLGSKAVVTNTPWHREDLTYHLEENAGWPTLTMDIYGNIRVTNAEGSWLAEAERTMLRWSKTRPGWYRLKAHDPDPDEEIPLWPARYPLWRIQEIRHGKHGQGGMLPHEFARLFLCQPFDEGAARCQRDWIERCKKRGVGTTFVSRYDGNEPTFTGIDLGIGQKIKHDKTVLFTFAMERDGSRRILDIESGRWDGFTIVKKLISKHDNYNSSVAVETVSAQDWLRQWALKTRKDLIVRAHITGADKRSLDFGVESIFNELQNEAWIIPCDDDGKCHPEVQMWIDGMLYYQPPPAHTADHLMACWIARERSRKSGHKDPPPKTQRRLEMSNTAGF